MKLVRWHNLAAAATALLLAATAAHAQQSKNWQWCVNDGHAFGADDQIRGCTALIQSGKENRQDTSIAYNNRGLAHYDKEDYDRAIADFTQAIRLDPKFGKAYDARANAYSDKGDHDRAIADYNEAIRIDSANPRAFNNRCDELAQRAAR